MRFTPCSLTPERAIGRVLLAAAVGLCVATLSGRASAQDLGEEDELREQAIQERQHLRHHEISASVGLLPIDVFIKDFTVGGSYTLRFNHLFSWEIANAYGVVARNERLINAELDNIGIPNPFTYVSWAVTTNLVFTPFYGKFAVVNRTLLFLEIFLVAGGGYGRLTNGSQTVTTQHMVVDAGGGFRVFFGEYFSVRFDVRWEGFFINTDQLYEQQPFHDLLLSLGLSAHFG